MITYEEISNGLLWAGLPFLFLSIITLFLPRSIISRRTHYQIEMWGWGLLLLSDIALTIAAGWIDWKSAALPALHTWLFWTAWRNWKDSNDDDDLKKRFKNWAKNKLPKLSVIKLRPIQNEGS